MVCLVHLQNTAQHLLRQVAYILLHAVVHDEHRGDDLQLLRDAIPEPDRSVRHRLTVIIYHHIEITQIDSIYLVFLQKSSFGGIQLERSAPIVYASLVLPLLTSGHQQQNQQYSPNLFHLSTNWTN